MQNISAAKAVADVVRTTLGPRSMLKMILDASGGIVMTNDGNAILREIDVTHPAAKSMVGCEKSRRGSRRRNDERDYLAGEILHLSVPFWKKTCTGYRGRTRRWESDGDYRYENFVSVGRE